MFKYKQFEKGKSPRGDLKYMSLEKNNENFDPNFQHINTLTKGK